MKITRVFEKKGDAFKKLDSVDKGMGKYVVVQVKYGNSHIARKECHFLVASFKVYGD